MNELEFAKRGQALAEKWRNLPPTDNFIFGKMFSDERLCKELLERLLGIKIDRLAMLPQIEKTLQTSTLSHGIRLDVYAEDESRAFDVEIQTTDRNDLPQRIRYYQSAMDVGLLERGDPYSALKESYVIFLCTFDPKGLGLPTYEFQMTLKNRPDVTLGDKRRVLLYNIPAYESERTVAIREVLEFFATQKRETEFGRNAGAKLDEIRNDEDGRLEYMTFEMALQDARHDGRSEGIAIGIAEGEERGREEGEKRKALEDARNLKKLGVAEEIIAQATGLPPDEVAAL